MPRPVYRSVRFLLVLAALCVLLSIHTGAAWSQEAGSIPPDAMPAPPSPASQSVLDGWLEKRIGTLIGQRPVLAGLRLGVAVRDLQNGRTLVSHDADGKYNVASNTKLVTTAAAMHLLGGAYRFRTGLYATEVDDKGIIKGDLYLRGRGDPSLDIVDIKILAEELGRLGIRRIQGGLAIDDSYFDDQVLPPRFDQQPDEQASFRAPVGAVSLGFNMVTVHVQAARVTGQLASVTVSPANDYVRVTNKVTTVARGRTRIRMESKEAKGHLELLIGGQIRVEAGSRRYRRRIADPLAFAGAAIIAELEGAGLVFGKRITRRAVLPDEAQRLTETVSRPMSELIDGMGKFSNNYVAEMLLKTIGAEAIATPGQPPPRPASWEDGLLAVRTFLTTVVGLPPGSFRYDNGSGLFDASEFSPNQIVQVLSVAHGDYRYGPDLLASLAIAGADGTLRRRFQNSAANGYVRAKTGTLDTASALSGYAARDSNRVLAFAILVNDMPAKGKGARRIKTAVRALQEDIADALVLYLAAVRTKA